MADYIIYSDELYHWGIKGMRWGVRRYQNKDGSLTPAGKKRLSKLDDERDRLTGVKSGDSTSKKKSVSDMSDEELLSKALRNRTEKTYMDSERERMQSAKMLAEANPNQVSAGRRFAKKVMSDVVTPALTNAGKSYLEKFLKDKLGLNKESEFDKLKKEVDMLDLMSRKKTNLENLKDNETKRMKRENEEYQTRKTNEELKKYFSKEDQANRERRAREDEFIENTKRQATVIRNAQTVVNGRNAWNEYASWASGQSASDYNRSSESVRTGQDVVNEYGNVLLPDRLRD